MNIRTRRSLQLTAAAIAFQASLAPALAQSDGNASHAVSADASDDRGIADIVVTATRSNASLQKVPLAISAFSSRQIEEASLVNVFSLSKIAPSLHVMTRYAPGNAVYQLRGQFQNDAGPTIDPSVGVYFDDVYIARSQGGLTNFVDLERIEVLKGPQGTLFGKNTPGGAVRFISKKPTDAFEGYGKVSYESYDRFVGEGVINLPLADGIALRTVGQFSDKRGGYATNTLTGKPIDHEKTITGRALLKIDPTPDLQILLQGDYTRIRAGGVPTFFQSFFPEVGALAAREAAAELGRPGDIAFGNAYLLDLARRYRENPRLLAKDQRYVTASTVTVNPDGTINLNGGSRDPSAEADLWGVSGTLEYSLGDTSIKSITAYRHLRHQSIADFDGTSLNLIDLAEKSKGYQFSEEVILHGKSLGGALDWTVGGQYFRDKSSYSNLTTVALAVSARAGGTTFSSNPRPIGDNTSYGLFAQGTYNITDALSLTAGARYTIDKRRAKVTTETISLSGVRTCSFTVANGLALLPSFEPPCLLDRKATFKEWAYTASLNYQIDPEKLVYVRTSRGFRAGGFSGLVANIANANSFDPEIVTDYELGLKADWFSRMFRTNLAVYYSHTSKPQQTIGTVINGTSVSVNRNAGKRNVYGAEAELVFRPSRAIWFDSSIGYTHAELENPDYPGIDFLTSTPKWTYTAGANTELDASPEFVLRGRADLSHRGSMYGSNALLNAGRVVAFPKSPAYTLLGLRVSLAHRPTGIEFAVYGTNLTNKYYFSRFTPVPGFGYMHATLAEPRVIGGSIKIPFGSTRAQN
jgi:iron complex outermembrane receptor protein